MKHPRSETEGVAPTIDLKAHKITLAQAREGLVQYKTAVGLSPHTISDYKTTFKKLFLFFDSKMFFEDINRKKLVEFFAWLQEDYISNPDGVAPRNEKPLAPKTIRNIHTNLSALWTWAVEEDFVQKNVAQEIDKPPASPPVVEPYTKEDVAALLMACDMSRTWKTRASIPNTRPTADRDRAIILTLLDTGVRASELCGIKYGDGILTTNSIRIFGNGVGKGSKERIVIFGKNTGKALWKSLLPRLDDTRKDDLMDWRARPEKCIRKSPCCKGGWPTELYLRIAGTGSSMRFDQSLVLLPQLYLRL